MAHHMDVSDLIAVYTGAFAGLVATLHMAEWMDGREMGEALVKASKHAPSAGGDVQGTYALELLRDAINAEIDSREAKERGPRLVD